MYGFIKFCVGFEKSRWKYQKFRLDLLLNIKDLHLYSIWFLLWKLWIIKLWRNKYFYPCWLFIDATWNLQKIRNFPSKKNENSIVLVAFYLYLYVARNKDLDPPMLRLLFHTIEIQARVIPDTNSISNSFRLTAAR